MNGKKDKKLLYIFAVKYKGKSNWVIRAFKYNPITQKSNDLKDVEDIKILEVQNLN